MRKKLSNAASVAAVLLSMCGLIQTAKSAQISQNLPSLTLASWYSSDKTANYQPGYAIATGAACEADDLPVQLWLPEGQAEPVLQTLAQWPEHPLAEFSNCFSVRWYHDLKDLNCGATRGRGSQQCDLALLPRELHQRQLVFVADEPLIASASTWQMVLPISAGIDVLAHEIGHWLGFADEYAMSANLARDYCEGDYHHLSVNVVTTSNDQLSSDGLKALWQRLPWHEAVDDWRQLGQPDGNGKWRLGSDETVTVGLFPSNTCAAVTGVYSWKPVARMTAMEYHDVNVWPPIYLEMLRRLK
ncbi:hypothetical protein ACFOD1_04140 [Pseudidiomarina halophila]|uniref:Peptidase n=1 Tax=Pseudidiomarina halophila TaxID=1449799 RepID=A0A432XZJ1_9GAMM|nr:hypothetical protein [Pseudidiomarina halophila]RUO54130.1 hypothetical protein CWI69_01490 [Pseudidiomarina halophila]